MAVAKRGFLVPGLGEQKRTVGRSRRETRVGGGREERGGALLYPFVLADASRL